MQTRNFLATLVAALVAVGPAPAVLAVPEPAPIAGGPEIEFEILAVDDEGIPVDLAYTLPETELPVYLDDELVETDLVPQTRRELHLDAERRSELLADLELLDRFTDEEGTEHVIYRRTHGGLGGSSVFQASLHRDGRIVLRNLNLGTTARFRLVGGTITHSNAWWVIPIIGGGLCIGGHLIAEMICMDNCESVCGDAGVASATSTDTCGMGGSCECVCQGSESNGDHIGGNGGSSGGSGDDDEGNGSDSGDNEGGNSGGNGGGSSDGGGSGENNG